MKILRRAPSFRIGASSRRLEAPRFDSESDLDMDAVITSGIESAPPVRLERTLRAPSLVTRPLVALVPYLTVPRSCGSG